MILGALCGLILAAEIEIAIAPDQPIPLVYADEPLVVELRPSENLGAAIRIEARDTLTGDIESREVNGLALIKETPYWIALDDFPRERGHYEMQVYLDGEEDVLLGEGIVAKVERRPNRSATKFILNVENAAVGIELAARAAGIGRVSASPARAAILANAGFAVEGRISSSGSHLTSSDVEEWIALGADDPEGLTAAIGAIRNEQVAIGVHGQSLWI